MIMQPKESMEDYYRRAAALYASTNHAKTATLITKDSTNHVDFTTLNSNTKKVYGTNGIPYNGATNFNAFGCTTTSTLPHLLPMNVSSVYSASESLTSSPMKRSSERVISSGPSKTETSICYFRKRDVTGKFYLQFLLPSINCLLQKFNEWCTLLKTAEDSNDLSMIQQQYSSFLKLYPLCFGYWRRWAILEFRLGKNFEKAEKIFQQAFELMPNCVDLWTSRIEFYQNEGKEKKTDEDHNGHFTRQELRKLFESGLNAVGNQWSSFPYWKSYIEFEKKGENYGHVGNLYYRLFTNEYIIEELQSLWNDFQEFLATYKNDFAKLIHPDEMMEYNSMIEQYEAKEEAIKETLLKRREDERKEKQRRLRSLSQQYETRKQQLLSQCTTRMPSEETIMKLEIENEREKTWLIKELDEKSARHQRDEESDRQSRLIRQQKDFLLTAKQSGYQRSSLLIDRRRPFEASLRRHHFHPKPLDESQLTAWRKYLEFEIGESSSAAPERVDRLFQRCLIVCHYYTEFWNRYVDWLINTKNDINAARNVLQKGRTIYLPGTIALWIKSAEIEEYQDNDSGTLDLHNEKTSGGIDIKAQNRKPINNDIACDASERENACIADHKNKKILNEADDGSNDQKENNDEVTKIKKSGVQRARQFLIEIDRLKNWSSCEVILHRIALERRQQCYDNCRALFESSLIKRTDAKVGLNPQCKPEARNELSATAKIKLAICYGYFLIEVDGDILTARKVLGDAKELRCCRQSLLLATIDIESRARAIEYGRLSVMGTYKEKQIEESKKYIFTISQLYEELLGESDLVRKDHIKTPLLKLLSFS